MFSKALLLLAICFQAFRNGNSAVTTQGIQHLGGWQIGNSVKVKINVFTAPRRVGMLIVKGHDERPDCKLEIQDEGGDKGDFLLVSFGGTADRLAINSYVNKKWGKQENYKGLKISSPIIVDVKAEEERFKITFKGKEYFRKYEFPLEKIKYMKLDCPGKEKITLTQTWSN